jgi:hypothetical protein
MPKLLFIFCCVFISACSISTAQRPIDPIRKIDSFSRLTDFVSTPFIGAPTPENYSICHNNGCAKFAFISLTYGQWQNIQSLFLPIAPDAKREREQIKSAIALLELYSGQQSTTYLDQAENSLSAGREGQLDCIDEATNTTVYLRMLANAGLLKFHRQASRTSRSSMIIPHNTATIIETQSNQHYAVDSWFEANGEPPYIVPLKVWKKGWKPEND